MLSFVSALPPGPAREWFRLCFTGPNVAEAGNPALQDAKLWRQPMRVRLSIPTFLLFLALAPSTDLALAAPAPAILFFAPHHPQTTLYVNAATGNDGFNCLTPATACKTLGGAVTKAAAGDTINMAAGVYPSNETQIDKPLTVVGAGQANTFLDGGSTSRVLYVTAAATLSDLTIRNGRISDTSGNLFTMSGGGILSNTSLTLRNTTLSNNSVTGSGGAIFHLGVLTVEDSRIIGNSADGNGGAIYSYLNGSLAVSRTLIEDNQADNSGGAIDVSRPTTLTDVTLRGNSAGTFGGALNVFQSVQMDRVTLEDNSADTGAAIFAQLGSVSLANSTVSGNTAGNNYGGIAAFGAVTVEVRNSTIAYNGRTSSAGVGFNGLISSGATVTIVSSIFAHNGDRNCSGTNANWTSQGYNLSSDATCAFIQASDLQPIDPLLAPLADNGGHTPTHALWPGSPAIDSGSNGLCPATDQRLVSRPFDGDGNGAAVCDRGAFEARGQIVISDKTVSEGNSGTTNAVFNVTLTPPASGPLSLNYTTVAGTAAAGSDFTATSGVLNWSAGQSAKTITVPVIGDTLDESDETFTVQLSGAAGADIVDGTGAGLILDDDGVSSLVVSDQTVLEGNSGTSDAVFTVTLSPASAQQVTVNYAAANGSATVGADFDAASGSLVFAPGHTTKTVTVRVRGDTIDEGVEETYTLALSNAQGANIADGSGAGVITDDDSAILSLAGQPAVAEGNSGLRPASFTVSLSLATSFAVTVDYHTGAVVGTGHATPDVDYVSTNGTLTFQPGQTLKNISVDIVGDVVVETDEDFFLEISNGTIAIAGSHETGVILNDDLASRFQYLPLILR